MACLEALLLTRMTLGLSDSSFFTRIWMWLQ